MNFANKNKVSPMMSWHSKDDGITMTIRECHGWIALILKFEIVTTLYRKKLGFVELVMIDLLEY